MAITINSVIKLFIFLITFIVSSNNCKDVHPHSFWHAKTLAN